MTDTESAEGLVHSILEAFEAKDSARLLSLCTHDVLFEFPFLDLTVTADELEKKVMSTLKVMSGLTFSEIQVEPLARPGWHLARYRARATVSTTGKEYRQIYITLVGLHDGRVSHFQEHFNTAAFKSAMQPNRPE